MGTEDKVLSSYLGQVQQAQPLAEFAKLDIQAMAGWSDGELAAWQSGYPGGSPQWLWADQQWKLRLLERQAEAVARQANKAAVIGALVGGGMGIAGACINAWLPLLLRH